MLLSREELQDRLITLHQASLELVKDVSLESLLERITSLACSQVGAKYAALGVLDDEGKLKQFITQGMTAEEIKRMPHPPRGFRDYAGGGQGEGLAGQGRPDDRAGCVEQHAFTGYPARPVDPRCARHLQTRRSS